MHDPVGHELAALPHLSVTQLRARYAELFREVTTAHHRTWLIRRIAWRLQMQAEGDLSDRAPPARPRTGPRRRSTAPATQGFAHAHARHVGVRSLSVSLTHTSTLAAAVVVAESGA